MEFKSGVNTSIDLKRLNGYATLPFAGVSAGGSHLQGSCTIVLFSTDRIFL